MYQRKRKISNNLRIKEKVHDLKLESIDELKENPEREIKI